MFEVGDLVTIDGDALKHHVRPSVFERWSTCKIGIVLEVEGYSHKGAILVKVHFQSLGDAYWLYSHEVFHVNHHILEDRP